MNDYIKNILNMKSKPADKIEELVKLEQEIKTAKKIINGELKYCNECDDYYLAKSFFKETNHIDKKICVYEDPINSGGNDYVDGIAEITYLVCPKGHKKEIDKKEYKK